ncbi:MAG: recombinase family protein [Actinobacteria bacterium]|nr:recombinase family protein [Actinomycetota bacterium]MCG2803223.1 recombinase family protein [Cellulomonas sp.]
MTTTTEPATSGTSASIGHVHGYARVSTGDQTAALQQDAPRTAGAARIWTDVASGATTSRPQLDAMLDGLLPGDTVAVWRLDRLGRSMSHLLATIDSLTARGVGFRSLTENIDTTTAGGRLVLGIFASLAEFERQLIRERTVAGLAAARSRGARLGRPSVVTPAKMAAARSLIDAGSTVTEAAAAVGISRPTLYRHLQAGALSAVGVNSP